jgi:enoyl-CoA hydratase
MSSDVLKIEQRDAVMVLHLDDGKVNALSAGLIAAIRSALAAAQADDSVGAVVLHGRAGKFCAGFDLDVMRAGDLAAMSSLVSDGGELVRELYGAKVPVVAACTGHALAAGALLLLGCDLRIGAEGSAKIGLNEVAIGMVLPDWAMTIAVERLSRRHLQRAVATARVVGPAEAVDIGYLDEVVAADMVLDTAVARAQEFAAGLDARAYAGTVRALRSGVLEAMAEQISADRAAGSVPTAE